MSLLFPPHKLAGFQEEFQFEMLHRLYHKPQVIKRTLVKDLDVGLGVINFSFQDLVEKVLVKIQNFSQSKNMLSCAYLLRPAWVAEKSRLTIDSLKRKVAEYEALQIEIEQLKSEIPNIIKRYS